MSHKTSESRQLQRAASAIAMLFICALGLLTANGCASAAKHPHPAQPMVFRHCVVTSELPGFVGCDCPNPLVTWDAQTKRKVVYCDGKVN